MDTILKDKNAQQKFIAALSKAQSEFPTIKKNQTAKAGSYEYDYADLATIIEAIKKPLCENGLAISFTMLPQEKTTSIICILSHIDGHSSSSVVSVYFDPNPQRAGSVITYWRRYLLTSILNIAIAEEDDDAQSVQKPPQQEAKKEASFGDRITESQRKRLFAITNKVGLDHSVLKTRIKERFGYDSTNDIERKNYDEIVKWIESDT